MLASFLMGLVGGQRGMTPLCAVSVEAARGALPKDNGAPRFIAHPLFVASTVALAAAELAGDKMRSAPDRVVPVGLVTRFLTSAVAGASLALYRQRRIAAVLGGTTAVVASYAGWRLRVASLPRYGQTQTGLIEDALVLMSAVAILLNVDRLSPDKLP